MKLILTNEAGELASASLTVDQSVAEGTGAVNVGFTCRMPDIARAVVKGLKALHDKDFAPKRCGTDEQS